MMGKEGTRVSVSESLVEDMKEAMRNNDKERLSVIRMARAAIKNVEIESRKELDDDDVIEILAKEVKQRRDSMQEYADYGRQDEVEKLKREIAILEEYLPEPLSEEELEELIDRKIEEVGAEDMRDMGEVMGSIMPEVKGRADGKVVNEKVRARLQDN